MNDTIKNMELIQAISTAVDAPYEATESGCEWMIDSHINDGMGTLALSFDKADEQQIQFCYTMASPDEDMLVALSLYFKTSVENDTIVQRVMNVLETDLLD